MTTEHRIAIEPSPKRVRAAVGGETLADSLSTRLLLETGHGPVYYFPRPGYRHAITSRPRTCGRTCSCRRIQPASALIRALRPTGRSRLANASPRMPSGRILNPCRTRRQSGAITASTPRRSMTSKSRAAIFDPAKRRAFWFCRSARPFYRYCLSFLRRWLIMRSHSQEGIRKMDAVTEADCRRRVREEMLAAANAHDDEVASRHRQRAEEYAGKARKLMAEAELRGTRPARPKLTARSPSFFGKSRA